MQKLNRLLSRSPTYARDLVAWTGAFLVSADLEESADERRLREAACYLSEVNWRAHPDYRGVQSFNLVSSAILPGVDHAERSYLSLVATLRYVGLDEEVALQIRNLMPAKMIDRASIIGAVMRIGSVLAAGMPGVLPDAPLLGVKGRIQLLLPPRFADLANDRLSNRIKSLAKMMGRDFSVGVDATM